MKTLDQRMTNGNPSSNTWQETLAYKFQVHISKDEDGIYSAVAVNLPGAGSCGDTEEEAMANFREAVRELLASYKEFDEEIPWKDTANDEVPVGVKQRWIMEYA
jgi:predicted RNase H-like HicB family nuclease